jgi:hypothetical protein
LVGAGCSLLGRRRAGGGVDSANQAASEVARFLGGDANPKEGHAPAAAVSPAARQPGLPGARAARRCRTSTGRDRAARPGRAGRRRVRLGPGDPTSGRSNNRSGNSRPIEPDPAQSRAGHLCDGRTLRRGGCPRGRPGPPPRPRPPPRRQPRPGRHPSRRWRDLRRRPGRDQPRPASSPTANRSESPPPATPHPRPTSP